MYARKVALLQVLKYVPRSVELATAFQLDATAEMGTQRFDIKDVPNIIEGTVMPEAEPEQKPPVVERTICADCGGLDGNHTPECKYDKTVTAEAETAPEPQVEPVAEPKAQEPAEVPQEAPKAKAESNAQAGVLTKKQLDRLWTIAGSKSVSNEDVHIYIKEQHGGKTSVKELTREEYDDVVAWMESQ
jgi:hypothetical protein